MKRPKISIWRLLPIVLEAARVGLDEVAEATAEDSDDGHNVTPDEAEAIAAAVGRSVAAGVVKELTRG